MCVLFSPARVPWGWEEKTPSLHPMTSRPSSWASQLLGTPSTLVGRKAWAQNSWELPPRLCPPHLPPPCWAWTGHSFSIPRDAKGVPLPESLHLAPWTDLPLRRESRLGGDGGRNGPLPVMLCQPRMGGQEVVLLLEAWVGGGSPVRGIPPREATGGRWEGWARIWNISAPRLSDCLY